MNGMHMLIGAGLIGLTSWIGWVASAPYWEEVAFWQKLGEIPDLEVPVALRPRTIVMSERLRELD